MTAFTRPGTAWQDLPSTATPVPASYLTLVDDALTGAASINIYATDYGAVGDNATNDTTALQNALNAVPTNGTLHLAQGKTYRITSALTGLSNKLIDGHGATIRQATTSANALTGVDVVNFSLRDITIAGATDSSPAGAGKGISITRTVRNDTFRVNLQRVIIHSHGGDGIDISNPITSHFENVEIRNCGGHGFNIHGVSAGSAGTSVVFAGTYANTNIRAGYHLDTMAYCSFVGTAADGNGIGYELVACQGISFSGCGAESQLNNNGTVAGYAGYSWKIDGGFGIVLDACWTLAQPAIALWVTGSAASVVATSFVENSPTGTATACVQTDTGTSSTIIHLSNTTGNSLAGTDLVVHDGGGLSVPGYAFIGGPLILGAAVQPAVATLTDGATVALNAALGRVHALTAAGNRTIAAPTGSPADGQELIIAHAASGGSRTLSLTTGTAGSFAFGTTITALSATTSGTTDYITCVYNTAAQRWRVMQYVKGF